MAATDVSHVRCSDVLKKKFASEGFWSALVNSPWKSNNELRGSRHTYTHLERVSVRANV